jgi:hypothetical protein
VNRSMKISAVVLLCASMQLCLTPAAHATNPTPALRVERVDKDKTPTPAQMLTELRDFRLCLTQLKQQAVNLFGEATRTTTTRIEEPSDENVCSINSTVLDETKTYMPPRKEWLVFYMNTLEPIVQLLTADIEDVEEHGHHFPKNTGDKIDPLWRSWVADVKQINRSLDKVQELIGQDSGSNIPLAKEALAIYSQTKDAEKQRYQAAMIFQNENK